jgi:Fe-S-cluster-containing dehydrogenase component
VGNEWPGYAAPQPGDGPAWIAVIGRERGQYPAIEVAYLPLPCQHCRVAPCIAAARDGACFLRPDGIVLIDPVKAKNQRQLQASCPYGAIHWNEDLGLPQKCTLCAHLLDQGWQQTRCVQACPTGALSLHEADERESAKTVPGLEAYLSALGTAPHVRYRNLFRFTRCFLAGSIATRREEGREECALGVCVSLYDQEGKFLAETRTDAFGDFKFDDLAADGSFTLLIARTGEEGKRLFVSLGGKSRCTGVHYI